MQGSTVVIAQPDGHMKSYIDSLLKLKDYSLETIAPGHGELMSNPHKVAAWIVQHREEREAKVLEATMDTQLFKDILLYNKPKKLLLLDISSKSLERYS